MKLLDDATVELPPGIRVAVAFFGILFAALAVWIAGTAGRSRFLAGGGAAVSALLALVLFLSAIRGRIWKWVWFIG